MKRHTESEHADIQTFRQLPDTQTSRGKDLQICKQRTVEKQTIRQQKSRDTGSREADKPTANSGQTDKEKQICFSSLLSAVCTSTAAGKQMCRPQTAGNQTCRKLHTAESRQANVQSCTPHTAVSGITSM